MKIKEQGNMWLFATISLIIGGIFDYFMTMPSIGVTILLSGIFCSIFLNILFLNDKKLELISLKKVKNSTEREYNLLYILFLKRINYICKISVIFSLICILIVIISNIFNNTIIFPFLKYILFYFISFILLNIILLFKRIVEFSKEDFKKIYEKTENTRFD